MLSRFCLLDFARIYAIIGLFIMYSCFRGGAMIGSVLIMGIDENNRPVPVRVFGVGENQFALATAAQNGLPVASTVVFGLADTEYVVPIQASQGYEFRARTSVAVRYAYETGHVAASVNPYLTLAVGEQYHVEVPLAAHTLYLACSTPGTVVELLVYEV
jgi:hypothetical protein